MPKPTKSGRYRWDAKKGEAQRPYRLWDAKAKENLPHRYYSDSRKAHLGALIEARWGRVGTTIEVYNCVNGGLLGQYTRTPTSVTFLGA
jgi:hypothetical protein